MGNAVLDILAETTDNYLLRNKTLPGMPSRNPDPRTTDDKFIIEIKSSENAHIEDKKLSDLIKSTGFIEIEEKKY